SLLVSGPDSDGSRDSNSGIGAPRIAARIAALSWRTFASWHAATGRSERGGVADREPHCSGASAREPWTADSVGEESQGIGIGGRSCGISWGRALGRRAREAGRETR